MDRFVIDIPSMGSEAWETAATFEDRDAAIRFVQERFGADYGGNVNLITELAWMEEAMTELGDISDDALDMLVHDTMSKTGSGINNRGIEGQLIFLLDSGWTLKDIKEQMDA